MARKIQTQVKPVGGAQYSDAVFAQLLITTMRIYSVPAARKR
jgi:hypothetical protein